MLVFLVFVDWDEIFPVLGLGFLYFCFFCGFWLPFCYVQFCFNRLIRFQFLTLDSVALEIFWLALKWKRLSLFLGFWTNMALTGHMIKVTSCFAENTRRLDYWHIGGIWVLHFNLVFSLLWLIGIWLRKLVVLIREGLLVPLLLVLEAIVGWFQYCWFPCYAG